jgi:hypothetical protein
MKKFITILFLLFLTSTLFAQIPTPNPANGTFYCPGDIQVYGDQVIDPLATYNFSISPLVPFNIISNGDQIEVTWLIPGVYVVEIEKIIGQCSSVGQATITVYPPTLPVVIVDALCQGTGTITLTANPLGTNPIFTGTGVTGNIFDSAGLVPGLYPITFTSVDANGCSMNGNGSITITPPPSPPTIFTN